MCKKPAVLSQDLNLQLLYYGLIQPSTVPWWVRGAVFNPSVASLVLSSIKLMTLFDFVSKQPATLTLCEVLM